jgi:hypothetical protein
MLLLSALPGYFTWCSARLTGAKEHAACTVTSIQSSRTVESSGGKHPYDVQFNLVQPDGRSFDAEEVIWADITMPTEYAPGKRVLCFYVRGRPDLFGDEPAVNARLAAARPLDAVLPGHRCDSALEQAPPPSLR